MGDPDFWPEGRRIFFAKLIGELGKLSLVSILAGGLFSRGEFSVPFKAGLTLMLVGLLFIGVIVFPKGGSSNA